MTFIKKSSAPKYKDTYLKIFGLVLSITTFYLINTSPLQANTTHKIITFEVTVPTGVDASAVSLEFPKLKYNKKIVFSWINDDTYSIWNNIFALANKKYRSNESGTNQWNGKIQNFSFHMDSKKGVWGSTGAVPSKFLEYTDGTGIKHRFATSVAAWYDKLGDRDTNAWIQNPYVGAKEMRYMQDFGYTINYHNLKNYDDTGQSNFNISLSNDSVNFLSLIDKTPKIMVEPDRNHNYITYGKNNSTIQMQIAQNDICNMVYPFRPDFTLDKNKVTVQRYFINVSGMDEEHILSRLATLHTLPVEQREWMIIGCHNIYYNSFDFETIEKLYGASGDDSIWFPSVDEFFEYWYMKEKTIVKKETEGKKIRFTLDIPVENNFYFQSISVLLNGISNINGISLTSGNNIYGTSFGISDNKLLVNLDFDESLPEKAERYTSIYEKEKTTEAYENAMYFVSQLKPEFKEPYTTRINKMLIIPVLSEPIINNGIEITRNNLVNISFKSSETAAYYRISELSDFKDANWLPLVNSTLFTLSSELGNKTIFIQLKNALYESKVASVHIELVESEHKVVVGLSGDNQTNKKEFVNGEMLNNVNLSLYHGWETIQLYDTSDNPLMKIAKDPAEIEPAMNKYGITARAIRGTAPLNPVLSSDEGIYPDRFIKYSSFFGNDTEIYPETRRLIAGFLKVPNGTYDIKIIGSRNGAISDFQNYRYQANNSGISIPESDIFNNNNSKFVVIKNVVVSDSTLLVCSWREPFGSKYGYYAPMNLIEIKPSVSTEINTLVLNENKIKIHSGKGKLTIDNETFSPLIIYTIDGRLLKQISIDKRAIEIYLPKGIYIVNNCKGIVF